MLVVANVAIPNKIVTKRKDFLNCVLGFLGKSNMLYNTGEIKSNIITGVICNVFKKGSKSSMFLLKSKSQGSKCSCNIENLILSAKASVV